MAEPVRPLVVRWREGLRDHPDAPWEARFVGMMMSTHFNARGENATMAVATLAREMNRSKSTADRGVRWLVDKRWVTRTLRAGATSRFDIHPRFKKNTPVHQTAPVQETAPQGKPPVHQTAHGTPVHQTDPTPHPCPPDEPPLSGGRTTPVHQTAKVVTDEVETTEVGTNGAGKRRDEIWDTLMDVCGINPTEITTSKRGAYNRAVKELRQVGATPSQIRQRVREYHRRWPDVSLSPTAFANRYAELGSRPPGELVTANSADAVADWLAARPDLRGPR